MFILEQAQLLNAFSVGIYNFQSLFSGKNMICQKHTRNLTVGIFKYIFSKNY